MRPKKIIIYSFYFPHLFSVSSSQHDACWELCKNRTPGLMQTTRSHHSNSCDSSWWGHSHCAHSVVMHSFSDCVFCGQCTVTQANLQCPCWWLYRWNCTGRGVGWAENEGLYNTLAHCVMSESMLGVLTLNSDLHILSEQEVDNLTMVLELNDFL